MKVTVVRSKWFRGMGSVGSLLLNYDGKMCCLGFAGLACGYTPDELLGIGTPAMIANLTGTNKFGLLIQDTAHADEPRTSNRFYNTFICENLMSDNDSGYLDPVDREDRLKRLGLKVGIEFEFVD